MAVKGSGGGGALSGAIRAGAAFVEIMTNNSGLEKGLAIAKKKVESFGRIMAMIGLKISATAGVASAAIGTAFGNVLGADVDVSRLADKLGISTEALTRFTRAAEGFGISMEDVADSFENFPERLVQAAEGAGEAGVAFQKLGLNAQALKNMPITDAMAAIADGMANVPNVTDQLSILGGLFSDKGQNFRKMFEGGAAGLKAMGDEAERLGLVLNSDDAKNSVETNKKLMTLWNALKGVVAELAHAVFGFNGGLTGFVEGVAQVAGKIREWIAENKQLVTGIAAGLAGATAVGAAFVALGAAAAVVSSAVAGVAAVFAIAKGAVALLLTPVGIVAGALAAGTVAFIAFTDAGKGMWAGILEGASSAIAGIKEAFGGIMSALQKGDFSLAAGIAMDSLRLVFAKGSAWVTDKWQWVGNKVGVIWDAVGHGLSMAWNELTKGLASAMVSAASTIQSVFSKAFSWLMEQISSVYKAFLEVAMKLSKYSPMGILARESLLKNLDPSFLDKRIADYNAEREKQAINSKEILTKIEEARAAEMLRISNDQQARDKVRNQERIDAAERTAAEVARIEAEYQAKIAKAKEAAAVVPPNLLEAVQRAAAAASAGVLSIQNSMGASSSKGQFGGQNARSVFGKGGIENLIKVNQEAVAVLRMIERKDTNIYL